MKDNICQCFHPHVFLTPRKRRFVWSIKRFIVWSLCPNSEISLHFLPWSFNRKSSESEGNFPTQTLVTDIFVSILVSPSLFILMTMFIKTYRKGEFTQQGHNNNIWQKVLLFHTLSKKIKGRENVYIFLIYGESCSLITHIVWSSTYWAHRLCIHSWEF